MAERDGLGNRLGIGVRRASLVALAALMFLLSACGGGAKNAASGTAAPGGTASGSPIRLGVLADVTGVFAIEATEIRLNTDLAVSQINANGGINGHRIRSEERRVGKEC
jgi:branched-chain amino acid transport system substrate-binding protein